MSIRFTPLILSILLVILAGFLGYSIMSQDAPELEDPDRNTSTVKKLSPQTLPPNQPLSRSNKREATTERPQDDPAFALKNERIVRFKDDAAYQKFLASLKERGLNLLGHSDRLRAVRVGFRSLSDLEGIDNADLSYNFPVSLPTPQGEIQDGAIGFGQNALAWLGINVDNSAWGDGITVAVIDSGVNQHIALNGDVTNIALTTLADGSSQLSHGTAVASIISGDHPLTPGVAPASEILSIRVTDESGSADAFTLAEGIIAAADGGAQVINISMGTFADSSVVADAVSYAQENGSVIVASSGNEGLGLIAFPAAYDGVISVGAVEAAGDHLDFSNTGEDLSITAPGLSVNAAWGEEQLTAFTGTSASAPFVSGAIAATMSENPQLTAQQAADLVVELANDAGLPGNDIEFGTGTLDVGRVMQNDTPGIFDAAVTGQVLVDSETPGTLPQVFVTVQNQGTETLINSPVTIQTPTGTQELNVSSLSPGQTQTFQVPIVIPTNGDPVAVTTSISTASTDQDNSNNARSTSFSASVDSE